MNRSPYVVCVSESANRLKFVALCINLHLHYIYITNIDIGDRPNCQNIVSVGLSYRFWKIDIDPALACGTVALPQFQAVALPQYHPSHLHSRTVPVGFATAKQPVKVTELEQIEIMLVYSS